MTTQPTLVFSNAGFASIVALTTLGINAKETESPIGYFGTGFKYAVAVLLRTGHKVRLCVGLEEYEFITLPELVRGQRYDIVHIQQITDPFPLGFTTDLGKNWEVWMAYRELWSNMKDEPDGRISVGPQPIDPDRTQINIEGAPLFLAHHNRREFLLEDRGEPLAQEGGIEFYPGPSRTLFYRGIKVYDLPKEAPDFPYTYNKLSPETLTEDRTLADLWSYRYDLAQALVRLTDERIVRTLVCQGKETFEAQLPLQYARTPSPTYLETVGQIYAKEVGKLSAIVRETYEVYRKEQCLFETAQLSPLDQHRLGRAINFAKRMGFEVDKYELQVVPSLGAGIMGMCKGEKLYVSLDAFQLGTKQLVGTLIEEYLHASTGAHDGSRRLQNILVDHLVGMGEKLLGEPL